jgi:hypothetical protein
MYLRLHRISKQLQKLICPVQLIFPNWETGLKVDFIFCIFFPYCHTYTVSPRLYTGKSYTSV